VFFRCLRRTIVERIPRTCGSVDTQHKRPPPPPSPPHKFCRHNMLMFSLGSVFRPSHPTFSPNPLARPSRPVRVREVAEPSNRYSIAYSRLTRPTYYVPRVYIPLNIVASDRTRDGPGTPNAETTCPVWTISKLCRFFLVSETTCIAYSYELRRLFAFCRKTFFSCGKISYQTIFFSFLVRDHVWNWISVDDTLRRVYFSFPFPCSHREHWENVVLYNMIFYRNLFFVSAYICITLKIEIQIYDVHVLMLNF